MYMGSRWIDSRTMRIELYFKHKPKFNAEDLHRDTIFILTIVRAEINITWILRDFTIISKYRLQRIVFLQMKYFK